MKPKKIVRYRISISRNLLSAHPRRGEKTRFVCKILHAINYNGSELYEKCGNECGTSCGRRLLDPKNHTIRANYELWKKRFEKINRGEAVLELYYWSGKPRKSKQIVFATLTKDDGIGIQKLEFDPKGILKPFVEDVYIDEVLFVEKTELAKNDGLSLEDWKSWFNSYELSEPFAIIHFTSFRY